MNLVDIGLLAFLAIATFLGLRMGIIKMVLSLVGLIVGVILAGRYYTSLSQHLTFISEPGIAEIVAFVIILTGVSVTAAVLAWLLKRLTSAMMLGWVNRLGGAIIGLIVGAVFCGALLAIWVNFLGRSETVSESFMAKILLDFFPIVLALLPEEFDAVRSFFQ